MGDLNRASRPACAPGVPGQRGALARLWTEEPLPFCLPRVHPEMGCGPHAGNRQASVIMSGPFCQSLQKTKGRGRRTKPCGMLGEQPPIRGSRSLPLAVYRSRSSAGVQATRAPGPLHWVVRAALERPCSTPRSGACSSTTSSPRQGENRVSTHSGAAGSVERIRGRCTKPVPAPSTGTQ